MSCDRELAAAERVRRLLARLGPRAPERAPRDILHRAEVSARYGNCDLAAVLVRAAREQIRTTFAVKKAAR